MTENTSRSVKPSVRPKYLTPDEVHRLIDAAGKLGRQQLRDQTLLTLIYRHGLRVGEAVDARWLDFRLDERTFTVRRLKGSRNSTHSLEPDTMRLLKRLRAVTDGPFVFVSERGGPLSVDTVQLIVKRAGEHAKLGFQAHPHMLRHAAGYALANSGTDLLLIKDYLGHADVRNTVIYSELAPERLRALRVR
jgi:site-specific recombinase XerD